MYSTSVLLIRPYCLLPQVFELLIMAMLCPLQFVLPPFTRALAAMLVCFILILPMQLILLYLDHLLNFSLSLLKVFITEALV